MTGGEKEETSKQELLRLHDFSAIFAVKWSVIKTILSRGNVLHFINTKGDKIQKLIVKLLKQFPNKDTLKSDVRCKLYK